MNWNLVKKDLTLLLRNPLSYIGIVAMVIIVSITVSPYLSLYENLRLEDEQIDYSLDGDVMDGYIPTPEEERWEYVLQKMEDVLISEYGLSVEDAENQINEINDKKWTLQEIAQYFSDEYGMIGFESLWEEATYKKADMTEMQQYLESVFKDETYTNYFARKYADYLGVSVIPFTIVIFSILLMHDMRKNIYGFIHTKPISGGVYVLGKYFTGIVFVVTIVIIQTIVVDVIAVRAGDNYGFDTNFIDIWKDIIFFDGPAILLTGSIMLFIAILFKNVIQAIPAMLLYFMYANIGSIDNVEGYHYQIKPGAIFVRFPQPFTETEVPMGIIENQILLLFLAAVLIIASIQIWERRRDT